MAWVREVKEDNLAATKFTSAFGRLNWAKQHQQKQSHFADSEGALKDFRLEMHEFFLSFCFHVAVAQHQVYCTLRFFGKMIENKG